MKRAQHGNTVAVHCTAKSEDGLLFVTTKHYQPLTFTVGEGHVIDDIEKAVIEMSPGESKIIKIPVDKALNPHYKRKKIELDRRNFSGWIPKVGQQLTLFRKDGYLIASIVEDVSELKVTLYFDYPLAGKLLLYDIKLLEVT